MKYRKLGSTEMRISEIGFGCWGIGGDSYGSANDNTSKNALEVAFENGINFFDTSDLYGNGHSEELIGNVFSSKRKNVIIASKGGMLPHTGFYMPQNFSSTHLEHALERSLVRLKTDYIDLYQMHSPVIEDIEKNNVIETLERMRNKGKIREFGISVRSPNDAMVAIKNYNFSSIQVNYNLLDQRASQIGLFDLVTLKNKGVIIRTPLVFGYLAGKLTGHEKFGEKDHRAKWSEYQLKRWAKASNLFTFLYKKRTPVQAALRFCLDQTATSSVIPGMMNYQEVLENITASNLSPLYKNEHELIKSVYDEFQFYEDLFKKKKVEQEKKKLNN